ncbi:hypothetical protein QQS21_001717 [Conoideocrella luteorostrata]|uniref:Polyketide synthase n=1 Tax=Conoideocrella luteorostrata TaxID=1105319 RepID=A0AAJ0CWI4_9HYPO|nr:hypothetical protein QQS21_001717 [Conoideocrella luteorostrata]
MSPNGVSWSEPVAIVGMSCRLSGDVLTPDDLWTLLSRSRDGWTPMPSDRFSAQAYHHPNPQKAGCFNVDGGYFMKRDFSQFDAPFFNITKQEAIGMDPQQRQLLECTYHALENAGIPLKTIGGRKMGVFVGGRSSDYHIANLRDLNQFPMFDATGTHQSIQAGRISYVFDLRGPSMSIDTACSSGLYALHAAVQSIRSGESESAIVAGANLHLQPDDTASMSMLGILNKHGKTFAFDHRAKSGFARGEGIACLVLKPLSQALKDGDCVRSLIVGTGTSQDGKTVGMTTPNGEAQEQLIKDIYAQSNISLQDVGFIEAHGTGTKVGDPIEANAIQRVFGGGKSKRFPLYMGSVKSNIGHLENVSGIVSVIKATMMLEKRFILPNVNFERANDAIPLDEWNIKVPTTIRPWPAGKRFVSVNNFGFGGSNAHAVLEALPSTLECRYGKVGLRSECKLVVITAYDEDSVKRSAAQLGVYLEQHPEIFEKRILGDIAYTLGQRRSHFPWRVALAVQSCNDLAGMLNGAQATPRRASKIPNVAFVYTGQGAQWPEMGKGLLESYSVFSDSVHAAAAHLKTIGADFDLVAELRKDKSASLVNQAHVSQPICTAVQIGLTDLFASWGVKPTSVVGHSSGEIGAAYATGAITMQDAMEAAYYRGQAALKMKVKCNGIRGAMLAVGEGPAEIKKVIKTMHLRTVNVACENSPKSITASGDEQEIDMLAAELEAKSIFNRKLRVEVAYHSSHMMLVADDYMATIKNATACNTQGVNFYSSLLGERLANLSHLGPSYWVDNLTKPVLFSSALKELYNQEKPDVLVEVGPHAALEGPIKQILKEISSSAATAVKYVPTLIRNQSATMAVLQSAGNLFVNGCELDFDAVNQSSVGSQLPTLINDFEPYPFSQHKYWHESRVDKQHRFKPFPRHDLLGLLEDLSNDTEPSWRNSLTTDDIPWLKDHCMQSLTTFPLAGYLCMIVEAASQRAQLRGIPLDQIDGFRFREVQVTKAFIMDEGANYETHITLKSYAEGTRSYSNDWDEFCISSWASTRGWLEHCRGLVRITKTQAGNPICDASSHLSRSRRANMATMTEGGLDLDTFYRELRDFGAGYSSAFTLNSASNLRTKGKYSAADVYVPDTASLMPYNHEKPSILSTPFIDLFFQLTFAILGAGSGQMSSLYMPSAIKEMTVKRSAPNQAGTGVEVVAYAPQGVHSTGPIDFTVEAWDNSNADPVIKLDGFRLTPVFGDAIEASAPRPLCYSLRWEPVTYPVTHVANFQNDKGVVSVSNGANVHSRTLVNGNANVHPRGCQVQLPGYLDGSKIELLIGPDPDTYLLSALVDLIDLKTGMKPSVSFFSDFEVSSSTRYICLAELEYPVLLNMTKEKFDKVKNLLISSTSMLWVTSGAYSQVEKPENNISQGLLRTVRSELNKPAACIDLDLHSDLRAVDRAGLILEALKLSLETPDDGSPIDYEFAEQSGKLMVPRVVSQEEMNLTLFRETQTSGPYEQPWEQPSRRLKIKVGTFGALDSLYWADEEVKPLDSDEIEIKVIATGMNFKDVVIAMGQVASPYLGVECSGIVARTGNGVTSLKAGDRVCAMTHGAYSTFARCLATSAAVIPDGMSFETAASIPVVYSTAYYGMLELAHIKAGEKILIHAASGGVGQAAIQLAHMIGAEIFATVGSSEKKQLIMDTYGIPEDHIFYSRDTSFAASLMEATSGEGVDVVVNSLAGDLLRETWECLAPFGRFIEIGKRDINSNTRLEMSKFEYNCTFHSVDLTLVADKRPRIMGKVLTAVMKLLSDRVIHPIGPITVVGISEVENALRKLQSGKTTGKVVVKHSPIDQVKATHPTGKPSSLHSNATYIIIGGTGGLGRSIARRLAQRGAGHIVLLSRNGKMTLELDDLVQRCRALGGTIHVRPCDVGSEEDVSYLLADLKKTLPPVRGVIHAAMVLKDMLFESMSFEDYNIVVRSKISGAINFHKALGDASLDFFVLLSSVAGIVGNRGQAAYAAANTFLDAFALYRRSKGLNATSLNLTAVADIGYLAENSAKQEEVLKTLSGSTMVGSEVLALIDSAIDGQVADICDDQCITGLEMASPSNLPFYASDAKFSHLREAALSQCTEVSGASGTAQMPLAEKVRQAPDFEAAQEIVTTGLREKLSSILMIPVEVMAAQQDTTSITAFGLDSLNAIELRNWIGKELQAHLQVLELLTSGGLGDLAGLVLNKSRINGPWSSA